MVFDKIFAPKRFLNTNFVGNLPESYDWRDHGAVTPVKDQGSLGTWYLTTEN
jgi:C1A family cysteine protease